ncbi:MAG TPA: tetratricopeptide repeat protein [Candidatus Xenobia bacterium]|nr:tetratricopeptide repeat protein [Candidatus Xenobia bacterium]
MVGPTEARRTPVVADLTGTTVGRFHIRAKLGEGGMGQVYRAEDTRVKRSVALKRISPFLRHDEHYRHRFLKEAERASRLNYDHIAGVYDVFEENDELFIVMEYVEGETLRHRLRQPFSVSDFLPIAVQCVEALVAAHEKGIAHRDLKPENIMLSPRGQVKVLDFGIAKLLPQARDAAATESYESRTSSFSGTVAYASPEALLEMEIDERSDIFSLGVVFYEMLASQHPFRVAGHTATTDRILHLPPQGLRELNPAVPESLERIVFRTLAKDPADRYATATELLGDLQRVERGEAIAASPRDAARTPARTLRLSPKSAVAAAALLVVALAVVYLAWIRPRMMLPAERVRVAVLPFANQTGEAELDRIRLTLTQVLISDLTGSPNIRVYPYEQLARITAGLEAQQVDISSPAAVQAVAGFSESRYVLAPRMIAIGDTVRIEVDVRDAQTGETRATSSVEGRRTRSAGDSFYALHSALATEIQEYFKQAGPGRDYASVGSGPRTVPAAYHFTEGKSLFAQGEYARALRAFERAVQEDPSYALARAWMGHVYFLLGYDEKARSVSEDALRYVSPQMPTVESAFIEANVALCRYDFASAEAKYRNLIRWYPDEAVWYAGLAGVYHRQGRFPEAIAQYQEALLRDVNYILANQELATLYRKTGELEQGMAQANKALQLCRTLRNRECEAYVLLELSEILRIQGKYAPAQEYAEGGLQIFKEAGNEVGVARANLRLGNVRFNQGDYAGARTYWQRLVSSAGEIRNNRDVVTALMNTGVSYSRQGDIVGAIRYYQQALSQQWPARWEQAQTKVNLATIYVEYGVDPEQGLSLAQEALATLEQVGDRQWQAQARNTLAMYYTNTGRYAAALDQINQVQAIWKAIGSKERLGSAILTAGRIHFVQNRYEQARQALDAALALAEETQDEFRQADGQILLGLTYHRLGDSARARSLIEEGARTVGEKHFGELMPQAHNALGELNRQAKHYERARESFEQAASLARGSALPEPSVEARAALGWLEAEQGNSARGLARCREAVAQARKLKAMHTLAVASIHLGRVQLQRREYEPALQTLNEVVALPNLGLEFRAQALHARAQALQGLGRAEEAKTSSRQAREALLQLQQTLEPAHRESFAARPDIQALQK